MDHEHKIMLIQGLLIKKNTFDRAREHNINPEHIKHKTYGKFIEYNKNIINSFDDVRLNNICVIAQMIQNDDIKLSDEESMAAFTAYSLYFDTTGKLVIVNPR
jgi:hypothetical protein